MTCLVMSCVVTRADFVVALTDKILLLDDEMGTLIAEGDKTPRNASITDITIGPDGNIYAALNYMGPGFVARFHAGTGKLIDEFVPYDGFNMDSDTLLTMPSTLHFGPSGDLYVGGTRGGTDTSRIMRYDGKSGTFKGQFAIAQDQSLRVFTFGADGNIYTVRELTNGWAVVRLSGDTGDFMDVVTMISGSPPTGIVQIAFGKDGYLYLVRPIIRQIDTRTGAQMLFVGYIMAGSEPPPWRIAFGPDGDVFVAERWQSDLVWQYSASGLGEGQFVPVAGTHINGRIMGIAFSGPRLKLEHGGAGLLLKRPTNRPDYSLETRTSLDAPWMPLEWDAINVSGEQGFFRLKRR